MGNQEEKKKLLNGKEHKNKYKWHKAWLKQTQMQKTKQYWLCFWFLLLLKINKMLQQQKHWKCWKNQETCSKTTKTSHKTRQTAIVEPANKSKAKVKKKNACNKKQKTNSILSSENFLQMFCCYKLTEKKKNKNVYSNIQNITPKKNSKVWFTVVLKKEWFHRCAVRSKENDFHYKNMLLKRLKKKKKEMRINEKQ